MAREYPGLERAVTDLGKDHGGMKYMKHEVDTEVNATEWIEIEHLVQDTWDSKNVGLGKDAKNLTHNSIKVIIYNIFQCTLTLSSISYL